MNMKRFKLVFKLFKPGSQAALFVLAFAAQFALSHQVGVGSICVVSNVLRSPFCDAGLYCPKYGDPFIGSDTCEPCRSSCPEGQFISGECNTLARQLANRQCLSSPDAVVLGHNCRWEDSQYNKYYPCKRGYWCPAATNDPSYYGRKKAVCRSCKTTCPLGFKLEGDCNADGLQSDTTSCVEDDECFLGSHNCAPGVNCTNTAGSFTCAGPTVDLDECALGTHDCGDNGVCVNDADPFRCECADGFSGDGYTCTDIDECGRGIHTCAPGGQCINTVGGFTCQCYFGFVNDGPTRCMDEDECSSATHNCAVDATCVSTPGSFTCACEMGFTGNGLVCTDVDECAEGVHECSPDGECSNRPGRYTCTCKAGFRGDGTVCEQMLVLSSNARLTGITAAQFDSSARTSFANVIASTLNVALQLVQVTGVADVASFRRRLQSGTVQVAYDVIGFETAAAANAAGAYMVYNQAAVLSSLKSTPAFAGVTGATITSTLLQDDPTPVDTPAPTPVVVIPIDPGSTSGVGHNAAQWRMGCCLLLGLVSRSFLV